MTESDLVLIRRFIVQKPRFNVAQLQREIFRRAGRTIPLSRIREAQATVAGVSKKPKTLPVSLRPCGVPLSKQSASGAREEAQAAGTVRVVELDAGIFEQAQSEAVARQTVSITIGGATFEYSCAGSASAEVRRLVSLLTGEAA